MPVAIAIGLFVAIGRLYGPRPLGWLLTAYVEFLRGTPLLLQLYFIFYMLPEIGVRIPAVGAAILGLAINYSAYEAEIYRAGIQAIPRGQMEAAWRLECRGAGDSANHRPASRSPRHSAGYKRFHCAIQRHLSLFSNHGRRIDQAVQHPAKRHRARVRAGHSDVDFIFVDEFAAVLDYQSHGATTLSGQAPIIEVHNLIKRFGNHAVLDNISLSVAAAEVAFIVGPSGGGKSTFLRCLNGLEYFQAGRVNVAGYVLTPDVIPAERSKRLLEVRRRVGMVFQQFNLFPHRTVLGNIIECVTWA